MNEIYLRMSDGRLIFTKGEKGELREGENLATNLVIELSEEFLGYSYNLSFRQSGMNPFMTAPLTAVNGVITFPIPNPLTAIPGSLGLEVIASDLFTGYLAKSATCYLKVTESISGVFSVLPDPYAPWLIKINEAVAITEANALSASESAAFASAQVDRINQSEQASLDMVTACTDQAALALSSAQATASSHANVIELSSLAAGYATAAGEQAAIAEGHATTAGEQAGIAATQAGIAEGHATTASQQAGIASGHATTASTKAGEASGFASTASTKATEASGYAQTASTKATESSGYATTATQQAGLASTKATEASGYAATAGEKAVEAAASAVTAVNATAGKANAADVYLKSEVYTKSEVDGKDALKADKLMATNLVTNGDFVSDLSGWGSYLQKATWVDGRAYFNRPVGGELVTLQKNDLPISSGDKIYARVDVDTIKSGSSNYGILNNGGSPMYLFNFNNMPVGKKTLTGVFDITSWGILYFNTLEGAEYYIDKVSIINLTATFGAGNESTKEQMDALLLKYPNGWFDGTVELVSVSDLEKQVLKLDNEKASKVQEAWITPTLLNGTTFVASFNVQYMKDSLGFVHCRGRLVPASSGAIAWVMPGGYRPDRIINTYAPDTTNAFKTVEFSTAGESIAYYTSFSGNLVLDGISFKAV